MILLMLIWHKAHPYNSKLGMNSLLSQSKNFKEGREIKIDLYSKVYRKHSSLKLNYHMYLFIDFIFY